MSASPNGIDVSKQKLSELQRQCRHHNIFPIFLPNTFYGKKPIPIFELVSSLVAQIAEQLECLTMPELDGEVNQLPEQLRMLIGDAPPNLFEPEHLERIALYKLVWEMNVQHDDFRESLRPFSAESEVARAFPDLAKHIDEEGLLILGPEFELHDGGINYREHVLHYHQCLRRNFSSNPNFSFTSRFASHYRKLQSVAFFRIAIDPRRFMHQSEYQQMMEFDTWYGPLFDQEYLDDLNHFGLTVLERERPSLFDFNNKLNRTEFYWSSDRHTRIKTFEVEELPSEEVSYDAFRITRYIHTERDTQNRSIRHFDAAAKVYDSLGAYRQRYRFNLPHEPRADRKPKLFRIDGDIPVETWIDLTSMFFKGNEMVLRYFDPVRYETLYREQILKYQNSNIGRI